jgi:hypothetical protein
MEHLAGHRLIRRIGTGARADVFLATATTAGKSCPVALKVFRPGTDPVGIGREVRAMLATPPAALPALVDTATTPDGRVCLLLEYLPGRALDALLTDRGRITADEIVTVAATVTATLQTLHDVGLSYPVVRPSSVRFDGRGRPVLTGLGSLVELPVGAPGVAVRRDAAVGLATFVHTLLAYLDPEDNAAPSARQLLTTFSDRAAMRPFPADLTGQEEALFGWAAAGPVRGAVTGGDPGRDGPRGTAVPGGGSDPAPQVGQGERAGRRASSTVVVPVRRSVPARPRPSVGAGAARRLAMLRVEAARRATEIRRAVSSGLRSGVRATGTASPRRASPRRGVLGPILVGGGLVVALSGGGLAALTRPPAAPPAVSTPPGRGTSPPAGPTAVMPGPATPGASDPGPAVPAGAAAELSILEGDDPAAAALELLQRRETCLNDASILCLEHVDQPGSVAMTADSYAIRQAQAVPESRQPGVSGGAGDLKATVQERTGNAALVVLSDPENAGINAQPASALVIKGEAGWRLRELFDY